MPHFLYILRCSDQSLYIGHTADVPTRVAEHNNGAGGRYTACRRPVTLLYSEEHPTTSAAVRRERQLKRWTAKKKEALINGDLEALHQFARRRR